MFVRKKQNKSGSSADIVEVDSLFKQGQAYIKKHKGQVEIDFSNADEMFFAAGLVFLHHTQANFQTSIRRRLVSRPKAKH